MANNRIGGILSFLIDGQVFEARGNFVVTGVAPPGGGPAVKRTGVAGQDRVHGYIEEPVVPSIKGDLSVGNSLDVSSLMGLTDVTVQCNLANGRTYVLSDAWTQGNAEIEAHDGKVPIVCEGLSCDQI